MNENIPFDDNNGVGGADNNDPMTLLIMHKAWREIFDSEEINRDNAQHIEKGRE